ncbi:hypothetical protein T310_8616, partial [Rasamsonia emersonii CBS 393.64]
CSDCAISFSRLKASYSSPAANCIPRRHILGSNQQTCSATKYRIGVWSMECRVHYSYIICTYSHQSDSCPVLSCRIDARSVLSEILGYCTIDRNARAGSQIAPQGGQYCTFYSLSTAYSVQNAYFGNVVSCKLLQLVKRDCPNKADYSEQGWYSPSISARRAHTCTQTERDLDMNIPTAKKK